MRRKRGDVMRGGRWLRFVGNAPLAVQPVRTVRHSTRLPRGTHWQYKDRTSQHLGRPSTTADRS
ncbi:hypothetical protein CERSUDRAFT_63072 [Gelatoporia subvermispora B]|uniref:Uncharacterized protein n=1 Tax=Ceriporiopsis subvermispora (strain B) TaxID=914234 RepID=M2PWF6_CERS8|nr:hypothetical protein CERSUDRAFT_63072 [Gelatoporia subvermispora B]